MCVKYEYSYMPLRRLLIEKNQMKFLLKNKNNKLKF